MQFLLVIAVLYALFWGALGAATARRACMNPWIAALVSIVLPFIGVAILVIVGMTGDRPHRAVAVKKSFAVADLVLLGVGIFGGALLAVSGWLPWIAGSVGGEVAGTAEDELTVAATDALGLSLYSTVLGVLVIGLIALTWRWGHRYLLPVITPIAGISALLGTVTIGSHATLAPLVDRAREWGQAVTEVNGAEVDVSGEVTIGPGPWLALFGGALVLIWALLWSVITTGREDEGSSERPATRSVPTVAPIAAPAPTKSTWEPESWGPSSTGGVPESWANPQGQDHYIAGEDPKW